jgi:hypothetical protein
MPHPLVAVLKRALGDSPEAVAYLALVEARLSTLGELSEGRGTTEGLGGRTGRILARRFLKSFEATWDDGDETLVRGYLDSWAPIGEDPLRVLAERLLVAAGALATTHARRETLLFFLWEMESVLEGVDLTC